MRFALLLATALVFSVSNLVTLVSPVYAKEKAAPQKKFNYTRCMQRKQGNGINPRDAARGCDKLRNERT